MSGKKTQVRKILKFPHLNDGINITHNSIEYHATTATFEGFCPEDWMFVVASEDVLPYKFTVQVECPYHIGDVIAVKESWNYGYIESSDEPHSTESWFEPVSIRTSGYIGELSNYFYKADELDFFREVGMTWKSAASMPEEASRLFLRVTGIRAERLQDMKVSDVKKEGFPHKSKKYFEKEYWNKHLRSSRKSLYNWDSNPFVWVINFEVDSILDK